MKIPLQEKIAELEQRIVRLESAHGVRFTASQETKKISTPYAKGTTFFGPHWNKMWEEFHLAMKEMFQ